MLLAESPVTWDPGWPLTSTRDGSVNAVDAALTLRLALGDTAVGGWRFYGEGGLASGVIAADVGTSVSVHAVLPGDLDGSWAAGVLNSLDPLVVG